VKEKAIPFTGPSNQFHTMFFLESMYTQLSFKLAKFKFKPYNVFLGRLQYC
jgi:hypothetical protein